MRVFDEWLLLPQRIALHEPTRTAVIADVHLGYAAARQRLGDAIPARGVEEELQPLLCAAQTHAIDQLIVAGDLFERGFDPGSYASFLRVLERSNIRFAGLTPGNHDRGAAGPDLPLFPDGYDLAGWRIVHGDRPSTTERTLTGHWHPALRRQGRKFPCFLVRENMLILPAFSLDAAGVDVRGDARWRDWRCYTIVGTEVTLASAEREGTKMRRRVR